MTENQVVNQGQTQEKPSDKELNFRKMEDKHRREMQDMQARLEETERKAQEALAKKQVVDDEDDDEPYVAPKKLEKKLAKHSQNTQTEIQKAMEVAKQAAKEELKQELWLEQNPDFYDVLQHAEKFAQKAPKLAETILRMPEGFDRQKLVYQNIKELGIDKPPQKESSMQDKIDANRRSPYYQPSGVASAPYAGAGDYSPAGQKNAYAKMKELQAKLRS